MKRSIWTLLALVGWCTASLLAQEEPIKIPDLETQRAEDYQEAAFRVVASAATEYLVGSDLDGPSDSVDVWSNRISLNLRGPVWPTALLEVGLSFEHRNYNFEGSNTFFPGTDDPWDSVNSVGMRVMLLQGLAKDWAALALFDGRAAAESGAEMTDGLSGFSMLGAGHQFNESFRLGLGVAFLARFEEDLLILPAFYLDWMIDEEWTFSIFGPRAQLAYEPDEDWRLQLSLGFDGRRFRLDDDGMKNDGIAQETRLPLALELRYRGVEDLEIALKLGVDLYREYRISDRNGDNDRSWEANPGVFFGFSLDYHF